MLIMTFSEKIEVKDVHMILINCKEQDFSARNGEINIESQAITVTFPQELVETINEYTPQTVTIDIQDGIIGGTPLGEIILPPINLPRIPITIIL